MPPNQSDRQASVQAVTGTNLSLSGDWQTLFNINNIPANLDINSRLLLYINLRIGSSYTNLPAAKAAFAQFFASTQGPFSCNELANFTASTGPAGSLLLEDNVSAILLENNVDILTMEI